MMDGRPTTAAESLKFWALMTTAAILGAAAYVACAWLAGWLS